MSEEAPTPDELEQGREADPDAPQREPDPEHPVAEPAWLAGQDGETAPDDADPADVAEQARPVREWSETDEEG